MKFQQLLNHCEPILNAHSSLLHANPIGSSRQGRDIHGFCLGSGSIKVSLIAGCHADEPVGPLLLRPYGGASIAIKISESWEKPPGGTNRVYSYEDIDFVLSAGATLGWSRVFVDVRWSWGMLGQVIDRDHDNAGGWNKADGELAGVEVPAEGDRTSAVQAGLGISF